MVRDIWHRSVNGLTRGQLDIHAGLYIKRRMISCGFIFISWSVKASSKGVAPTTRGQKATSAEVAKAVKQSGLGNDTRSGC